MSSIEKLRWQCRRGTRELDMLLLTYLDTGFPKACVEEQKCFAELLTWEDDELLDVLLGGKETFEIRFGSVIEKIRRVAAPPGLTW